jgi:hypothetical protein
VVTGQSLNIDDSIAVPCGRSHFSVFCLSGAITICSKGCHEADTAARIRFLHETSITAVTRESC